MNTKIIAYILATLCLTALSTGCRTQPEPPVAGTVTDMPEFDQIVIDPTDQTIRLYKDGETVLEIPAVAGAPRLYGTDAGMHR